MFIGATRGIYQKLAPLSVPISNTLLHCPWCFGINWGRLLNGSVRHPLLYRGWLEGILELFLFLLAVSAHFDGEDHDHGDDNENNDGNDNGFEQEFEETHDEEYCWA